MTQGHFGCLASLVLLSLGAVGLAPKGPWVLGQPPPAPRVPPKGPKGRGTQGQRGHGDGGDTGTKGTRHGDKRSDTTARLAV